MIATIAVIAAIGEKNKSSAIAAMIAIDNRTTTIAEIELFLSQRSLSLRSLESAFHMIATIDELFFAQRSQRSQRSQRW